MLHIFGWGAEEVRAPDDFVGEARPLDGEGPWLDAAADLGCEVAAIRAVAEVETRGAAFLASGRPALLFERHVFHRLTEARFDAVAPSISHPRPGGYGQAGEAQFERLREAAALDRTSALKAASWGRFQIMGFNAEAAGHRDVEAFVAAMCEAEENHLAAFVAFVRTNRLDRHLRTRDWAAFARGYNGPAYAKNAYDRKMAEAYGRFAVAEGGGGVFQVTTVATLQRALSALGASPGPADGLMGPRTRAAIEGFERQCGLPVAGRPTPTLMTAVQAVLHALGAADAL